MAKRILVLSDGDTWDAPEGCKILTITDWAYDKICSGELNAKELGNTATRNDIIEEQEIA